jgi:hypothetical protein
MLASQDYLLSPQPGDFTPECQKLKSLVEMRAPVMTMYQSRDYPFSQLIVLPFIS